MTKHRIACPFLCRKVTNGSKTTLQCLKRAFIFLAVPIATLGGFFHSSEFLDRHAEARMITMERNLSSSVYTCGWPTAQCVAEAIFSDFSNNPIKRWDDTTNPREPSCADILVHSEYGPCENKDPKSFPGKVLIINGESVGDRRPQGMYQIGGTLKDSNQSVLVYSVAMTARFAMSLKVYDHLTSSRPVNTGQYKAISYVNRNCSPQHRERAIQRLASVMPIHYGSFCNGFGGKSIPSEFNDSIIPMPHKPEGDHYWVQLLPIYQNYVFCFVMENKAVSGYITEKILSAFLSGCVPIYYGTKEVFQIFNHKAFVFYDAEKELNETGPDPYKVEVAKIQHLLKNQSAYIDMLQEPILANGNQTLRDYFSISDDVPGGEGHLKHKIWKMMGIIPSAGS